ncbi:hypothetical protein D3C85_562250 [compost metagenome]
MLVAAGDLHPASVAAFERGRRHPSRVFGPQTRWHFAQCEITGRRQRQQADLPIQHRKIDVAALPRPRPPHQGRQDADGSPEPRGQVTDRQAWLDRAAAPLAGQAHDAAHRLEHRVITLARRIGPRHAKARARKIDQSGIAGRDRLPVQPVLGQRADRKIFHHDIALLGQPADQGLPGRLAEVHGDRLLAAIERQVVGGFRAALSLYPRLEAAGFIARARLLDLDDCRPQLGQDHRRERARQHTGQIQNGHAIQRPHRAAPWRKPRMITLASRPTPSASARPRSAAR